MILQFFAEAKLAPFLFQVRSIKIQQMSQYLNPIKKPFLLLCLGSLLFPFMSSFARKDLSAKLAPPPAAVMHVNEEFVAKYDSLQLEKSGLSEKAFLLAMHGFEKLAEEGAIQNRQILSIVDFSLPSAKKRLFIIDLIKNKILFNTYVAHGRNSGAESATSFSNAPESNKSSLGFYVTKNTYRGEHGYSLRLDGVEQGINDNAFLRNIVMHGAPYVSEKVIATKGYLGRSLGCPAVPLTLHKAIISKIKNGSCLFLYGPDESYASQSKWLQDDLIPAYVDTTVAVATSS